MTASAANADAPILSRTIPSTGETLPAIGLGTWQAFDVATQPSEVDRAQQALARLVEGGGTLVDSSPMYGSAEEVVGRVAAALDVHKRVFFATKVWISGRAAGVRQMEASLAKMRIREKGPLDLMQVHNLLDVQIHLATLRDWKKAGRIRYLGVTHYHGGAHADLERHVRSSAVDFIQINYSIAEPQAGDRLLRAARDAGVAVIVNRPFAEGAMFARTRGRPLPDFAGAIAASSWSQLFLKWILADPAVTCIIPGTRNADHVADNLNAARGALPDAALRERIAGAFRAL